MYSNAKFFSIVNDLFCHNFDMRDPYDRAIVEANVQSAMDMVQAKIDLMDGKRECRAHSLHYIIRDCQKGLREWLHEDAEIIINGCKGCTREELETTMETLRSVYKKIIGPQSIY